MKNSGLTEHQLRIRKTGIGSSDIAAVVGIDPWKTPLDVWLDKTNRIPDLQPTAAMRRGTALEPLIGEMYTERTGIELERGATIIDRNRPWRICTPDYFPKRGPVAVVEAKAPAMRTEDWGEEETDEVPEFYLVQVQWQLDIVELDPADVAALLGNDFRIYRIQHDPELCGMLTEIGERFWVDHVLADKMPEVTASDRDLEYLNRRFRREVSPMIEATPEIERLAVDLFTYRDVLERYSELYDETKNKLCASIGSATGIEGSWWKATWKKPKDRASTDWKAIATTMLAPEYMIEAHTTHSENNRTFRPSVKRVKTKTRKRGK